jgi:hypothetical protein
MESNVRGGQVCAKEVPKNENKVMKKRLLVVQIFFGIIMAKVNSAQNKIKQALKKITFQNRANKRPRKYIKYLMYLVT